MWRIDLIGFIGYCWNTSCPAYKVKVYVGVKISWLRDFQFNRSRCVICLANLQRFKL